MNKVLFLSTILLFCSCASIDLPPGGEKDIQPPQLVSSSPDSAKTYFVGDQIKLNFDEYITLNNLNKSLIISPPLASAPKIVVKGKTLILQLNETLIPNTTYQFYLDDGIKDLHEGNPTKNLRLVFSTGPFVDTAIISGVVKNAFSLAPEEDIKVFLYKEFADSQLLLQTPYYITKTGKNGLFSFNNIADGQYYCYAVKDENNNNKLDITERVAFSVGPILTNTVNNTVRISKGPLSQKLRVLNVAEISAQKVKVVFNKPCIGQSVSLKTDVILNDLSKDKTLPWHYGVTKDTVYVYLNSKQLSVGDLINVNIKVDSLSLSETLKTKSTTPVKPSIKPEGFIHFNQPFLLRADYFIRKTNDKLLRVFDVNDSSSVSIDSTMLFKNTFFLHCSWKQGHRYKIILDTKAITFYNQESNKADTFTTLCLSSEKTGDVEVNVVFDSLNPKVCPFLFVLEKNNSIVSVKAVRNDTTLSFHFLEPGEYKGYLFEDRDFNNTWTDVNYLNKTQSEPIWHLNSPIEVRTKWKTKGIVLLIN
ncbi:MAG: hypothetical protein ACI9UJ_000013 [bacterium]|jgi:uncharacterized protein (DUF2141 family)